MTGNAQCEDPAEKVNLFFEEMSSGPTESEVYFCSERDYSPFLLYFPYLLKIRPSLFREDRIYYTAYFSRCLNSMRRIFPDDVFGNSEINSIFLGYLYGAVYCLT